MISLPVRKPGEINVNLEYYKKAGVLHTVLDLLKDRAIIDFRGSRDLSAESDDIQTRGFDTRQFTTTVDGLAIQKTVTGEGILLITALYL